MASSYSVSVRGKPRHWGIGKLLLHDYSWIPEGGVEGVFGFPNMPCPLYGGRGFYVNPWATRKRVPDMYEEDCAELERRGMSLRLPLTNHYVTEAEFLEPTTQRLLERFHRKGNWILFVNDRVPELIAPKFPLYSFEASVIKQLDTVEKVNDALNQCDSVVPAFELHEDLESLDRVRDKCRVRLFANVSCERTCPARVCYSFFSRVNKNPMDTSHLGPACSRLVERLASQRTPSGGITRYDVSAFEGMGFSRFKALRETRRGSGQAA